jgi:PKD repeat protein
LVNFTNLSTGDYDSCAWDFGDSGTSSNCDDPSHEYTKAGVYTISLEVSGSGGSDTETKADYITVQGLAKANFSGSPLSGVAPMTVSFTNLSSGDYDSCAWDFGDGGTSSNCDDPSHEYTLTGVYTVSLKVSGSGGSDTETKTDYIAIGDKNYIYLPLIMSSN